MSRPRQLILIPLLLALTGPAIALDDLETWHGLETSLLKTPDYRAALAGEIRLNSDSGYRYNWNAGLKLARDFAPGLTGELHYIYHESRSPGSPSRGEHRIEIELTPRWSTSDKTYLRIRNRLELRFHENRSGVRFRSRHRLEIGRSFEGSAWTRVALMNEFFLDYAVGEFNQNRFYPLVVQWKTGPEWKASTWLMVSSKRNATGTWRHHGVLGYGLKF